MTALVTGSSRGLGRALAIAFAATGYDIILHGRDERALAEAEALVRANGRRADRIAGDLRIPAVRSSLGLLAIERRVDILVNNAGIYSSGLFRDMLPGDIQDAVAVNLTVPMLLTLAIYPMMAMRGRGLIVNINSTAGKTSSENEAIYCATKHGLAGFARSFQVEAARQGVHVLSVYLGAMDTAMTANREGQGAMIQPDEAAAAIVGACRGWQTLRITELDLARNRY